MSTLRSLFMLLAAPYGRQNVSIVAVKDEIENDAKLLSVHSFDQLEVSPALRNVLINR